MTHTITLYSAVFTKLGPWIYHTINRQACMQQLPPKLLVTPGTKVIRWRVGVVKQKMACRSSEPAGLAKTQWTTHGNPAITGKASLSSRKCQKVSRNSLLVRSYHMPYRTILCQWQQSSCQATASDTQWVPLPAQVPVALASSQVGKQWQCFLTCHAWLMWISFQMSLVWLLALLPLSARKS